MVFCIESKQRPLGARALVTGGAGFIGSHLVDALVEDGWQVAVLDNLSTGRLENLAQSQDRIEFVEGDIRDLKLVGRLAKGCKAVFHQAAVVSVPLTVQDPVGSAEVNEIGTLHVLEACRRQKVKSVVLASSCAVYGDDPQVPKKEDMTPRPSSPYAVQKLAGEYYAGVFSSLYGLSAVCLRYFNVYGPRQDPSSPYSGVISIFMDRAVKKLPPTIYGDGLQYRDFIFVKDVVRANLLAASAAAAAGKVFNIGTGRQVTINDLWKQISKISEYAAAPEYGTARDGDIRESLADTGTAKAELGFEPEVSFKDGLASTFRWFESMIHHQS
ncbi:MAG: SDR family oxidoreductase [Desulfobacterales bacterium]|nr:SDR family oxidoreductase [Desulfobacterales bacterium]